MLARLIVSRLVAYVPTMLVVSIVLFVAITVVPGSAARAVLGFQASPAAIAAFNVEHGLNRPLPVRYFDWLEGAVQGNFGVSLETGQPVGPQIAQRLPITLELALLAFLIANILAIPLGVISASAHQKKLDVGITVLVSILGSVPNFWLGTIFVLIFAVALHVLPAGGYVSLTQDPLANLKTMILPALSLGLVSASLLTRMMRVGMIEELAAAYVHTAKAKGAPWHVILRRHALPNALTPYLTVGAVEFGFLFGSVVIIENLFSIPGIGSLLLVAIENRDYPVLLASALTITLVALTGNMIVDIIGAIIDPRQVHRRRTAS